MNNGTYIPYRVLPLKIPRFQQVFQTNQPSDTCLIAVPFKGQKTETAEFLILIGISDTCINTGRKLNPPNTGRQLFNKTILPTAPQGHDIQRTA